MSSATQALRSEELAQVEAILEQAAGIVLSKALRRALQESFGKAAEADGVGTAGFLSRLLAGEPESIARLVEHSVIGETYFFRHPEQFAGLKKKLLTDWRAERPLSIWSAGCASGEEPYSIAGALAEAGREPGVDRILATDISQRALARARAARYGSWSIRRLDPRLHKLLFQPAESGEVEVVAPLRSSVRFKQHNLVTEPPPALGFHAVFCRNVLIYFSPQAAAAVLHKFVEALRPGGLLVLGPVEVPMATSLGLEWLDCEGATLLRKPVPGERKVVPVARPSPPAPAATLAARGPREPARPVLFAAPAAVGLPAAGSRSTSEPGGHQEVPKGATGSALFERARDAARNGQIEEAERLARDSAARELLPESYLLLSLTVESRGDLEGAIDAVRRALYLEPSLATGHAALVPLFKRAGRPQDAERARRNALRALEGVDESVVLPGIERITAGALKRALEQAVT
ncbi:MAG: CheR family methyltransferase [Myxococcales bacterium]|jgi:chemotaxis protein methyltransferase CheR